MNKFLNLILITAIVVALFEQSKEDKNVYVIVISIVAFMIGMMRLSAKTPSKNQQKK